MDIAAAIQQIQNTAQLAAPPAVRDVTVDDGAGNKMAIPVAFVPNGNGSALPVPLLDAMQKGTAWACDQRLKRADGPDRREGVAKHETLASFTAHANRFKAAHSAIWAAEHGHELMSILDYHPAGAESSPRWGRHRGVYACQLSDAWNIWGGGMPRRFDQEEFAELLDERDGDLCGGRLPNGKDAPDPATLITLASNLEVYAHTTAKRERDPNTGRVKIAFAEDKGVVGQVMPPPAFLVHAPVFQDLPSQPIEIRLRVTVEGGGAHFQVKIHDARELLRAAYERICQSVAQQTELPVFQGLAEIR